MIFQDDTFAEELVRDVVKPCRKGLFLYVNCETRPIYKRAKKVLSEHLSNMRGVFSWKGLVVLSMKKMESNFKTYFDMEITIWKKKK